MRPPTPGELPAGAVDVRRRSQAKRDAPAVDIEMQRAINEDAGVGLARDRDVPNGDDHSFLRLGDEANGRRAVEPPAPAPRVPLASR